MARARRYGDTSRFSAGTASRCGRCARHVRGRRAVGARGTMRAGSAELVSLDGHFAAVHFPARGLRDGAALRAMRGESAHARLVQIDR